MIKKINSLVNKFCCNVMYLVKNRKKLLLYILSSIVLHLGFCFHVFAKNNNCTITSVTYEFTLNNKHRNQRSIEYPEFSCNNSTVSENINDAIDKFIDKYQLSDVKHYFKANYKIFESPRYFSIKWTIFNKDHKLIAINALNFNIKTGLPVQEAEIFDNENKNFMHQLIKLSKNRLVNDMNWSQFVDKIVQSDIQFYTKKSSWYLVFNPRQGLSEHIIDMKMPNYLIKK